MRFRVLILAAITYFASHGLAHSQNAFQAFVVGNAAYKSTGMLSNPVRDAKLMLSTFQKLGFDITQLSDDNAAHFRFEFERALDRIKNSEPQIVFIYVAGHGVQISGKNYLVPTDASAWKGEQDAVREGIDITEMISKASSANSYKTFVFFLDICRTNPFRTGAVASGRGLASISVNDFVPSTVGEALTDMPREGTGLARIYISYSTQPGDVASDGLPGENSPYAMALSEGILELRGNLNELFPQVQKRVSAATSGRQVPWLSTVAGTGAVPHSGER